MLFDNTAVPPCSKGPGSGILVRSYDVVYLVCVYQVLLRIIGYIRVT